MSSNDVNVAGPTGNLSGAAKRKSWRRRLLRWLGLGVFAYGMLVIIGMIPVNNDFREASPDEGVTIYVTSNAVHADIIVPMRTKEMDWREQFPPEHFEARSNGYSHVAIGWADRDFYLNTPEWKAMRLDTTAKALFWPSSTVMHVQFTRAKEDANCRAVTLSPGAYQKLVDYVLASFADPEKTRQPLGPSYGKWDAFYDANGHYHALNTCNCWVGRGLKRCGVRVPWYSPLPKTVLWYLPD